jgi:crossover junction endodeoxyribonuclease RuvC
MNCRPQKAGGIAGATKVILGIDPGLERTGYAVLSVDIGRPQPELIEAGIIRMVRTRPLPDRLAQLADNLAEILRAHQPTLLACEELYAHYKHPRTAIRMAHARGVILASAAGAGVEVLAVSATRVKKTLTGSGHASKRQMQQAVMATLSLGTPPEPHDVADAIGVGLCGWHVARGQRMSEKPPAGVRP